MSKFAITFNAPLTLGFAFVCIGIYMAAFTAFIPVEMLVLKPVFDFRSWQSWLSLLSYATAHADTAHLLGNLSFILLLGPMLEQKYGDRSLAVMMLITTLLTALVNLFIFKQALIGSSGLVFMMVMLTSFANMKRNTIPLTFLLVGFLFLGKEVLESYKDDNIAQFAHITGGICGSVFGFYYSR